MKLIFGLINWFLNLMNDLLTPLYDKYLSYKDQMEFEWNTEDNFTCYCVAHDTVNIIWYGLSCLREKLAFRIVFYH